jgi:hypothetical protein
MYSEQYVEDISDRKKQVQKGKIFSTENEQRIFECYLFAFSIAI